MVGGDKQPDKRTYVQSDDGIVMDFDTTGMTPQALEAWHRLAASWGQPIGVNSAYRDPEHNARVGGAKNSQHMHGNAFDVDVSGLSLEQRVDMIRQARAAGFGGVGVYGGSLHFDVGPTRNWGADYGSGSTPDWAREALGGPAGQHPANALVGAENAPVSDPSPQNALAAKVQRMNALSAFMPRTQQQDAAPFMNRLLG